MKKRRPIQVPVKMVWTLDVSGGGFTRQANYYLQPGNELYGLKGTDRLSVEALLVSSPIEQVVELYYVDGPVDSFNDAELVARVYCDAMQSVSLNLPEGANWGRPGQHLRVRCSGGDKEGAELLVAAWGEIEHLAMPVS